MIDTSAIVRNQTRMFIDAETDEEAMEWLRFILGQYREKGDIEHKAKFIAGLMHKGFSMLRAGDDPDYDVDPRGSA